MRLDLVPLDESHFAALRQAFDVVAREKRYLAATRAPDEQDAFAFYRNIVSKDLVLSVALVDGQVAGWCDVLPTFGQARAHVGILGIALSPEYRHRGVGRQLIEHAIARAWAKGFTRIELTVRADNANAKTLYERVGFVTEGLQRRAFCIDAEYCDAYTMALLR